MDKNYCESRDLRGEYGVTYCEYCENPKRKERINRYRTTIYYCEDGDRIFECCHKACEKMQIKHNVAMQI